LFLYIFPNVSRTPGIKKEGAISTNGTCAIFHYLDLGGHFENTILVERVKEKERISGANRLWQTCAITNVILFIVVIITTEVMEFLLMIFPCMKEKWWGIHT
jgi:hypothetical protein